MGDDDTLSNPAGIPIGTDRNLGLRTRPMCLAFRRTSVGRHFSNPTQILWLFHSSRRSSRARTLSWLNGDLHALASCPPIQVDPFQCSVWTALREIPPGQTRSYGQIAHTIGRPTAARAVGAANGANPVPLFVPCHRVIGSNGALSGFAFGVQRKRWLLDFEALHA